MAVAVTMPKLGLTMTEGKVVKWLKPDGSQVSQGEAIVVVMTKKITSELESPAGGILHIIVQPRESRTVGTPLGFVLQPGEDVPEPTQHLSVPTLSTDKSISPAPMATSTQAPTLREVRASPAAKRLARELAVDITRVVGTGRGGRISEGDVQSFNDQRAVDSETVDATPLARRMMEDEGLDPTQVTGRGPHGRITEDDVLALLSQPAIAPEMPPGAQPFTGMRQAIAETMIHSLHSMAQLTLTAKADVTPLATFRDLLREQSGEKIDYTDILVKAVGLALRQHPALRSTLLDQAVLVQQDAHVGVAVALDEGLIVPVVRHADSESLSNIHRTLSDLAVRARSGKLAVDEVTGSTFTITNLGMYGIEAFTPIINPPEVAILGVGQIAPELALADGQVVARSKMTLSLTIDHRLVDGAPGAAFLQTLVRLLEKPDLLIEEQGA